MAVRSSKTGTLQLVEASWHRCLSARGSDLQVSQVQGTHQVEEPSVCSEEVNVILQAISPLRRLHVLPNYFDSNTVSTLYKCGM